MSFCRLLCQLIGVVIAVNTNPSIATAQTLHVTLPESGEASKPKISVAGGQNNPGVNLRLVVPCPVGSPADIVARQIARVLSESSNRPLDVENIPSGAEDQSQADDRTLLLRPANPALHSACGD